MRQIIAGNWKMHGLGAAAAQLADAVRAGAEGLPADLVLCPPFTQIGPVAARLAGSPIRVGGQDCHAESAGAHTGDIAAAMLADVGATMVILGHSERRHDHGESSELVRLKVLAARAAGLTPIVCVGETEIERLDGRETEAVGWQISASLPEHYDGLVAYEPVWAIGSGRTPDAAQIEAMHLFIREELERQFGNPGALIPILYGGSVKPSNAAAVLRIREVGGALVGGACLEAESFLAIAAAALVGPWG